MESWTFQQGGWGGEQWVGWGRREWSHGPFSKVGGVRSSGWGGGGGSGVMDFSARWVGKARMWRRDNEERWGRERRKGGWHSCEHSPLICLLKVECVRKHSTYTNVYVFPYVLNISVFHTYTYIMLYSIESPICCAVQPPHSSFPPFSNDEYIKYLRATKLALTKVSIWKIQDFVGNNFSDFYFCV